MTLPVRILSGLAGAPGLWDTTVAELTAVLPESSITVAPVPWCAPAAGSWAEPGWDPVRATDDLVRPGEVLIAHSFAATLVLAHLCAPERVQPSAAVLVSPFYRSTAQDFTWATLEHFLTRFDQFLETGLVARSARQIDPEIRLAMARSVRDRMGPYGWMAFMAAYLATPALDTSAVSIPVHVVYGSADGVAPPEDAVLLAQGLPTAVLHRVEAADHFPMTAAPAQIAGAVRDAMHRAHHRAAQTAAPLRPTARPATARPTHSALPGRRQPHKELT